MNEELLKQKLRDLQAENALLNKEHMELLKVISELHMEISRSKDEQNTRVPRSTEENGRSSHKEE